MVRPRAASLSSPLRRLRLDLHAILRAATAAADPARLIQIAWLEGRLDSVRDGPFALVAAGKAAWPMARALNERCAAGVRKAVVAGPVIAGDVPDGWGVFDAAHPFPDVASARAGAAALGAARGERLVLLLSGGASSMLCAPAEGVTLEDKAAASRALMHTGVDVGALNCVRKHLSSLKGGGLGAAAARALTLAISDVHHPVADDPSVIGSGPAVPDPSTFARALAIAAGVRGVPAPVLRRLERGAAGGIPETVKPGDARLAGAGFILLGNRLTAVEGAARAAEAKGYQVAVIDQPVHGEAREAAAWFMARAGHSMEGARMPLCVVAAGETTVRVRGPGKGGRNQEFALAAAPLVASLGRSAALASAGTDGVDGPTNAAGAIVDSTTMARAAGAGRDPAEALAANDAYPFFAALGDLIVSGPTGTNVGDVQVLLMS